MPIVVWAFSADSISVNHIGLAQFLWASFVFLFTVTLVATALYVSLLPLDWGQLMVARVVTFATSGSVPIVYP